MTISDIRVTLKISSAFGKGVYSVTPIAAVSLLNVMC